MYCGYMRFSFQRFGMAALGQRQIERKAREAGLGRDALMMTFWL